MTKQRVLFHRTWTKFNGGTSGGQLKVRDAFEHVMSDPTLEACLYFPPQTIWFDNPANHWLKYRHLGQAAWHVQPDDILFFSGFDWKILPPTQQRNPPAPVINIVQPRHTRAHDPRQQFLGNPAIRIVKSSIGKQILEDFGVNGPMYLIPDAIDLSLLPQPMAFPDIDLLIVGLKQPGLAIQLKKRLSEHPIISQRGWHIEIQIPPALPTRGEFLDLMNRARFILFLPLNEQRGSEGFYLPPLEAMAMKKLVICPFAVGNADYCIPSRTCLQPAYHEDALIESVVKAAQMPDETVHNIIREGYKMSLKHSIDLERRSILNLIKQAHDIWNQETHFIQR